MKKVPQKRKTAGTIVLLMSSLPSMLHLRAGSHYTQIYSKYFFWLDRNVIGKKTKIGFESKMSEGFGLRPTSVVHSNKSPKRAPNVKSIWSILIIRQNISLTVLFHCSRRRRRRRRRRRSNETLLTKWLFNLHRSRTIKVGEPKTLLMSHTHRHTDTQTHRHTDTQTHRHAHTHTRSAVVQLHSLRCCCKAWEVSKVRVKANQCRI